MEMIHLNDEFYMKRAIELAQKGVGKVNSNPLVGAVIVKNGEIISEGYHMYYGGLHAERNAIADCKDKEKLKGATIYVTLEPCCHYGKQPPCTEAIIESGISEVIIGSRDPNPLVAGKGVKILREHGIQVREDFMREECDRINDVFFYYITHKRPYVVMKYAMTMDGKIAAVSGKSQWITNEKSRHNVHLLRNRLMGIMVGIGTVITDNPMLTCRIENGRNPIRIICDSSLRIDVESNIVKTAKDIKTIIAYCNENTEKEETLKTLGCELIKTEKDNGHVDLDFLMNELGQRGIDSVLLEGGGSLNYSALEKGIVNEIQCYVGSKIFGGNAKTPVGGKGIEEVKDSFNFELKDIEKFESDVLLTYKKI